MQYRSTRSSKNKIIPSTTAILKGLAPDGGLYVPADFPKANFKLEDLPQLSFRQITAMLLSLFFDDFSKEQITAAIINAYGDQWDDRSLVPIEKHNGNFYMELFHGPTLSLEDFSLQLLPQLMDFSRTMTKTQKKLIVLSATTADSGIAAMRGFINQDFADAFIFYPEDRASSVQVRQLLSSSGKNMHPFAVKVNFNQIQNQVAHLFNNDHFQAKLASHNLLLSSADSVNIAYLIPKIAYYLYAYGQLVRRREVKLGDPVNFAIASGTFSNALAGYYAKNLGLPLRLLCVSDENDTLTEFLREGKYDKRRKDRLTNTPAIDILLPNNLERLLFDLYDEDSQKVASLMNQLTQRGHYQVDSQILAKLQKNFIPYSINQRQVISEIKRVYNYDRYVIDPHTAISSAAAHDYQEETGDTAPMVIASTASPYKFPETIYEALAERKCPQEGVAAVRKLHEEIGGTLSIGVRSMFTREPDNEKVIESQHFAEAIDSVLKLD